MTTPEEQLEALAQAWAKKLGGKTPVELTLKVEIRPDKPARCCHYARVGISLEEPSWFGCGSDFDAATADAEKDWRNAGCPEPGVPKLGSLQDAAAKLGYRLVKTEVST